MGVSAATTDFMVIFVDPHGVARAWGVSNDYQEARKEAKRQLDIYLKGKGRLGGVSLTSADYEEEVHHIPKEKKDA